MDDDPKNNKGSIGYLNSMAGIITAIATLTGAITGLIVVLSGGNSPELRRDSSGGSNSGGNLSPSMSSFTAVSYCSISNVNGYGESTNIEAAQKLAVDDCTSNGGVPECCASNVKVSPN